VVDGELLNKIYLKLIEKNYKIATAESCTGGLIGHNLTNISGSSNYFDRGIISYSNESKIELLDVPKNLIDKYSAVSEEVAVAMAEGGNSYAKKFIFEGDRLRNKELSCNAALNMLLDVL